MSSTSSPSPAPSPTRLPEITPAKRIYRGKVDPAVKPNPQDPPPATMADLPPPPPWRAFNAAEGSDPESTRGSTYLASDREITAVNVALYLRRPLLITGRPGAGKTSLAYSVAYQLKLGRLLTWPITSRSTLQQGLYHYDAIARLQDASRRSSEKQQAAGEEDIGRYLKLGPLGAALALSQPGAPRVLLIDEIDKSDIDLPNDLLHVFEEGSFEIPELSRLPDEPRFQTLTVGAPHQKTARVPRGQVKCQEFPIVFLTSNGERDFPPAFLRRCVRLDLTPPKDPVEARAELTRIVAARLGEAATQSPAVRQLIEQFQTERDGGKRQLANDQLLNAVALVLNGVLTPDHPEFRHLALRDLAEGGA
jgi:MoxR-like ATPase